MKLVIYHPAKTHRTQAILWHESFCIVQTKYSAIKEEEQINSPFLARLGNIRGTEMRNSLKRHLKDVVGKENFSLKRAMSKTAWVQRSTVSDSEHWRTGWRESSVDKELAVQSQRPAFKPQHPLKKPNMVENIYNASVGEGRRRQEKCWGSLANQISLI